MKKILVIVAHPNIHKSRANRTIIQRIENLPNVTIRNLYELYPYFFIDVAKEQKLLLDHDLIVFQHPIYWYSMPALLKEWMDQVLELGFAYGPGGKYLAGKDYLVSVTAGGPESSYGESGYNNFDFKEFLPPFIQTAKLCQMNWQPPLILFGSIRASVESIEAHGEKVRDRLVTYSNLQYQPGESV
jgi:putative NADPH-quinone reductase